MKTWICGSVVAVAVLVGSTGTASAGGFGVYIGTFPSYPRYPAYAAPRVAYSAPQVMYQPAPVAYAAPPVYAPAPTFVQPGYPAAGLDRYRARVRYRPLHGDFVRRFRGRATW